MFLKLWIRGGYCGFAVVIAGPQQLSEKLQMNKNKENDILETTLSIAEKGYSEAYRFLLNAYEESPSSFGQQTFYFLACLAGGADGPGAALEWLRKAIQDCNWWYRPEVLEDDDLAGLKNDEAFLSLKAISDDRYAAAVSKSKAIFSWKKKTADNLFLVIHGNTQNSTQARADWKPIVGRNSRWQIPWKWYKTRAITKLLAAVFLPDAICSCVRSHFRLRAAIC